MAIAFAPAVAEAAAPVAAEAAGSSAAAGAASGAGGAASKKAASSSPKKAPKKSSAGSTSKDLGDVIPSKSEKPSSSKSTQTQSSKGSKSSGIGKRVIAKVGNRKILLPELIACLAVLILGTLVAPKGSKDDVHRLVIKGSALMGVFFVLAILSTGGGGAQKTANILGFLITLSYLLNSSDIHNVVNWVNSFFSKSSSTSKSTQSSSPSDLNSASSGSVAGDIGSIAGSIGNIVTKQ